MINFLALFHISFFISLIAAFYTSFKQVLISAIIFNILILVVLTIIYQNSFILFYFVIICFLSICGALAARKVASFFSLRKLHIQNKITEIQNEYRSIKKADELVLQENTTVTSSLEEIETLYEGLKLMNSTLEFEKTLKIFCNLLTKLTHFEQGRLITLEKKGGKTEPQHIFRLLRSEDDVTWVSLQESQLSDFQKRILKKTVERNELIFEDCEKKDGVFSSSTIPAEIKTVLSVPLRNQDEIIAVLILHQCKKIDIEKIRIMVIQLAMELEKGQLYEIVKELSIIDGLTKLYLRRHLFKLLKNEIERLGDKKMPLSLLMIDIDRFKSYNDKYGHLIGDMILQYLSNMMKRSFRQIDIICRYGGEEFIVALPETDKETASTIAERFRQRVEGQILEIYDNKIQFTISIGISSYPNDATSLEGLINKADKALYIAKSEGRNRIAVAQ